ncbi:MAG: phage tail protein [Acidobacteria bacterium]|nr:phage tail protein [Acidobacteriota bacterium]
MADPFIGEIKPFAFDWAPRYWSTCSGQVLLISQNTALFSLLGTTYGGNGQTTFSLPDLRGRVPIHFSGTYTQGAAGGTETVTLTAGQIPQHSHSLRGSNTQGVTNSPAGNAWGGIDVSNPVYTAAANPVAMAAGALGAAGGNAHGNVQPSLVLNFCIALTGIFPSRN